MTQEIVLGAILAGGAGARIGGRKAMVTLAGRLMAAHVADVLRPSVADLAIAGDAEAAAALGVINLDDPAAVSQGPLVGVLSALEWCSDCGADWVVTAPCDTPLLPGDVVARLLDGARKADAACAETQDGLQPLVCVWRRSLATRLRDALAAKHPPVHRMLEQIGAAKVWFDAAETFMNVNTPEELWLAEEKLGGR